MTIEQFNNHVKNKKFFKIEKRNKKRYVVANNLDNCISKFIGWVITEVTLEEFLNNREYLQLNF